MNIILTATSTSLRKLGPIALVLVLFACTQGGQSPSFIDSVDFDEPITEINSNANTPERPGSTTSLDPQEPGFEGPQELDPTINNHLTNLDPNAEIDPTEQAQTSNTDGIDADINPGYDQLKDAPRFDQLQIPAGEPDDEDSSEND